MPESSVKITLGVQLDKSEIDKQLQEMQKELDAYKLKIGVDREQLTQDTGTGQSTDKSSPKSFESPEGEENIDFGVLSDLANEKFNETFKLIDTANDNLIEILGEVKGIRGALDGLSPVSTTQENEQVNSGSTNSTLEATVKESGEKITNQLTDIVAVLSTISNQLSEKKDPLTSTDLAKETDISSSATLSRTKQPISEDSQNIVPLVQDAVDKISNNINQAIETFTNQFAAFQEIIDIATNSFAELVSTTKSIIESMATDIIKVVTNSLDEILTEIQDSVIKLLQNALTDLSKEILNSISNDNSNNIKKREGGDNSGSTISSGISSLISVIVRLQEVLTDQLGKITGQLFPEIITQLQFDFFKSLIGGAVERLGAVLINQSAGGAAKLAEGVVTGNVFRQSDPAAAATMAFGEGFAANDPALLGSELSKISKKLDVLNPAIAEPNTQAQLDSASEVETVRMTAVLETIAGNISASNIILDKIVGAIEASDTETNEQQLLEGTTEIIKMTATLESVVDRINTTNQLLGEIQSEISLISFDSGGQPVLGESPNNLLPAATDYTDVSFEDIVAQVIPPTPIDLPDVDPDKLASNFSRIITDVFKEVGISVQKVAEKGKLPKLNVDTENKLKGGSKYNRKDNTISVSESTAKDLSSGNDISKDSFLTIAKELRKAIQSSFTDKNYETTLKRAGRGISPVPGGVQIPLQKQRDLIDRSKLSQVKNNVGDAKKNETNINTPPSVLKGVESLNTDAEVFAQNLADKLFSTPIDIPDIEQLFKAPSSGDKGKDSNKKNDSLLVDLIQSSDESNVLLREGIQGDRTNIDRLSGDKFVNESSSQLGGDPASSKIEGIVNEIKGFGSSFNKDFSNIFDTRLKDFAINASKAVGVPDTGWVDNITNFVQYLDIFANLLKIINPALADSFGNVREKVVNDSVSFASQGMEGIARKGAEFYNQVRSNPNLQKDSIANRINQGRDFINTAKNRVTNAIPNELIGQGRDAVGAAKNRAMNAIPPELISRLQSLQQQVNDSGAIDGLRSVLDKVNNVGGQLIGTIGQLINSLGNLINSGESVPAVKDFLGNVQTEINARTKTSNNESLFRADIPPDIWDKELTQASPEFAFDAQNLVTISPLNMIGDSSMDIPDPWAKPEKPSKGNEQKLSGEDNKGQDKVQVDLATFIQKALPIAVAGLVVAKLGTSLLNNALPGKSNIERKVSVDSLQSTLTKALIGAVTVAIGQKLAPRLSKVFTPDKNVTLSERVKSIFSKPANVPPESQPTPYPNLSADELVRLISGIGINNTPKVSSLDNSGFLPLERMGPLDNLFRNPIGDESSRKNSLRQNNTQGKGQADSPTFIQKSLPLAIAGLVVAKLGTSLLNKMLPGKASVERKDSVNNLQSTLTKALIAAISVAKLTNAPLLPKKENIPDISKLNNSNLPKAIGLAVAAALSARFIGSTVKSIRSGDRQESLGEKLIKGLFERLTNQTRTRGRQIDERFAGYTGKKRSSGDNGGISGGGMFESLLSKLPVLLTGLVISRLIADVVPKIVDGFKQGSSDSSIDSVDLSQKSSIFSGGIDNANIADVINPQQKSVDLKEATRLAKEMTKDSGLPKKEQKKAEKDFIDLYLSNPQALKTANARNSGNNSATTEMEQLDKNFKAIADEVFRVSGLNPSKIDKAGLFPRVSIDSENKLKGASAYSVKDNQVTLSSDMAKMVSSSEGISKEAFTTIAHELRHAMQLSFGKNNINAVAAIAQDSNSLPIGKNAKINLKTEGNLLDPSKAEEVSKQVDASLAMTQTGALSEGIKALEVDAEVFAQNLADVFYGLSGKVPDTLFKESQSVDSLDSISATQKEDLLFNKENKTTGISPDVKTTLDLPKIIALAITGVLTSSLVGSVLTAKVKGAPRQSSIGEKFFNLVGGVIKSPFRIGKSKSEEIVAPGFFEGLVSKLPLILTGLIIAGLLSQVVPALLAGDASKQTDNAISQEKTEVVKESVDVATNADPSQSVKESVDYETIAANMAKVAEQILQTAGVDTTTLKSQGLMPNLGIDSENQFQGASVYHRQTNKLLLSEKDAKGFIDNKNISKESFATLAHELRHSMQTNFGQVSGASQARDYKSGAREFTTQDKTINLLGLNDLTDKTKALDVDKQAMYSTRGVSLDNYNAVKAWEIDAETFAQNLTDAVYGVSEKVPDILPRANVANFDKSLDSRTDVKEKTISSLDKGIKDLGKTYKTISSQATNPNLANLVTIDIPDIITKETPELLDTSRPNLSTEPPVSPGTSFPLPTIASNNQQDDSVLFADSGMGDKAQTILQAIKTSIERITVLLDNIAAQLGASVSPELNLGAESMSTIDSLYRGVTEDNKKTKKEQGEEKEKTRAVIIGEKIGTKLENAIDNMQSRLNKKMQDAGMDEDEIRGIADQAGGYMFANLSAFFPAGAIGVALAPVIASVSALGIPIAAAVNQLAPIGQMLADTMRTMTPIQTRFETIGGDPESGQQMLDFAAQVAQEYNTPLLASIEGFSRLAAASKGSKLEGQDTEELFKGVSQAMAALGLNAQDASLIFLAFQQVISKGKVAAEELRGQIGERLPGAIQLAAKSMGMTVADFSAALDRGEISSNILLPKLAKAFQEEYGAGAKAASKGFLGTLNKIENSLFNFRRLMTDEFGGIVAGIANAAATALDAVLWLMDNVLLKSGLMFNAILGIQAQIVAGTAFIFSKLDLPMALAKALSGGYGKMSLVLIPFVFGLFQEIIGTVLAKILGVEVNNAVEILTGFFSTLVGRVIQTVIDLSKDPKQVMEGVVNIVRSISIGVKSAAEAFLNFGIAIRTSIGVGVDELTWFIKKLGDAERLINKLADNSISKIYAPQVESPQAANTGNTRNNEQGFASMFNGKAIARLGIEFFSLFAIMIQTMVLLRIVGEQALKAGDAFKTFGGKFKDALLSMKTGKSILSMLTLGFSGLNLLLAGLATLVVLMAFKSSSTNSFLSQLSNSVKALEGLNKNLDNLTNKKINITTEITQLDQAGVRDTPFQDKGLNLTPWRAKDQEQFTTDDVIRMIQKRIDSTAYRRDLPLLPDNFSESRGSLFDQGNLSGLGNVLTSQVGKENQPTSFDELVSLKDKLAEERKSLEDYLTLYLQLDATNTFEQLTKLKSELGKVDSQITNIEKTRGRFSLPGAKSSLVEGLNVRKTELQSQINSLEQQRVLTPGSDTMIGLTPLEAQVETLKKELKTVDDKLSNFSFPTLANDATADSFVITNKDKLLRRRESIAKSIEELQKNIGASVDDLEKEIKERSRRIQQLNIPNVADGKTAKEEKAKEVQRLEAEITALSAQKESAKAVSAREELAQVNQDLRAIQTFATTPGVFNNAFNQDDTVLREMVSQQLDFFSMVQNDQINPQRLDEGNLVSVLPELQRDVQKERNLTANRIRQIEEEIARLDTTGEGAKDKLAGLNKELKSFNNRLVGLKGLNIFLDISQSYANLGAGKQELQNTRITRSLTRLSEALKDNPVQSEALQQFQQTPTLPNLAQLEQGILIDLVPAKQAVTRAKSERENIATTPMLRTEQDLRSAGYVTKEQKQQLDIFRALEEKIQRDIQSARKTVTQAYSDYNQATAEGLDFQPALDNYYAVGEQLKNLQTQLQDLRSERDAFLDEVKTVAPPIQVDDKAREQRLAEVDQAIKEAESRVNELAKQYQLIQETKSGLGGLGQLGENLDVAAAKLREPLRGFAAVWESITSRREKAAQIMQNRADILNPALGTVGGFINQQQNLSGGARAGLVGALNSGDYAMTKTALESITIQDGKIFFNGEELTGTNEEIASFTKALKTASRILGFIGNDSNKGSRPVQQAIEEAFGIKTIDTQRAEISNQYFSQIASLATSGVFSDSQLMGLTQDGLKLTDAQKILDEVKNRDGLSNFQSVIQTMQDNGATPGEIRDALNSLQGLEQTFVDALALDPKGATKVQLGTVGAEEYTQTVGKLDQIQELAAKSSEQLGLQYYDGNINTWMNALKDVKPGFLENIQQLRTIEEELTRLGQKRIEVNEQLTRTDLSKDTRKNLTTQATRLDEQFRDKYREKKAAGSNLTESFMFYQNTEAALSTLAEDIAKSDLSQEVKDPLLAQIKQTRDRYIAPGLEALKQFEDLMSLSGEEALEAAGKSITRALENFEKIAKKIDSETQQKLADITTALLKFSSNKELAITDFNKSVAGVAGDPEKLAAEQNLAIAKINAQQSLEKLNAAKKTKQDVDNNVEISLQKAAFSPIASLPALELAQEKQIEALNVFSQAQEEYSQNIKALTEAQLAKIEADTQVPVRIARFNSKQKNINYKQQRLDGVLKESDVTKLQLQDEIGVLDIEIAATAAELESIAKDIEAGYITNIDDANEKISGLIDKQQDLISNRLDKLLEQENEERERSIKLLENQSSLSAKYFDVAINGYELLNKKTERYTKQLDSLTQVGEQLKTLSQAQFQFNIGRGETASSLIDAGVGTRERLSSEDLSPRQRSFQKRRLGALQQLGQGYGINSAVFGMNEDAALAEQQKIATKLAKEKLDAMEKEQAIAAKLLDIELQRNQIAAEMAVREAEIGKLRAEQAVIQAQFGLQQAILGKDPTAIKLAELEVQIAASQQEVANAELGSAKDNLALQALFAQMQREVFKLDSASARNGLIAEVAGNENVDIASILQSLKNFKNFDPTKANPREVFAPYLDWLNKQTPQRDPNTPIGMPLEAFNGDTQAWIDANVAIAKQEQEKANAQTPPEVQSLKNVFDKIFGEPVATKIDMSNGKVQDISKEIAILNAGRLGEKVAPTQEMIDSVSGQREIDNALEQARRLAQASEPVDNSRMASDVYSISTDMADAMSTFLTIAELLGLIAINTRGGGEVTGGNNPSGGGESTPPRIGDGGNAYDDVQQLLEQLKNARGIKDVLEPIVNATNKETPWATPLPQILGNSSSQPPSNPLDLSESILPSPVNTPAPANQQSAVPSSSATKVSAILNPTIKNSLNPTFSAPAVTVSNISQREPGYFYRNLANEVSPQMAYRVPPGVQATQGATSYQPVAQNTTINITNKIDAASQREMYAKIGEAQTKSILSALNTMA